MQLSYKNTLIPERDIEQRCISTEWKKYVFKINVYRLRILRFMRHFTKGKRYNIWFIFSHTLLVIELYLSVELFSKCLRIKSDVCFCFVVMNIIDVFELENLCF